MFLYTIINSYIINKLHDMSIELIFMLLIVIIYLIIFSFIVIISILVHFFLIIAKTLN
jgi:hypothetical protein